MAALPSVNRESPTLKHLPGDARNEKGSKQLQRGGGGVQVRKEQKERRRGEGTGGSGGGGSHGRRRRDRLGHRPPARLVALRTRTDERAGPRAEVVGQRGSGRLVVCRRRRRGTALRLCVALSAVGPLLPGDSRRSRSVEETAHGSNAAQGARGPSSGGLTGVGQIIVSAGLAAAASATATAAASDGRSGVGCRRYGAGRPGLTDGCPLL